MPLMAASVRTRVVSWNDAAEMNESVESDAFVIPSRVGLPVAGRPPAFDHAIVLFAELELVHDFFGQELGVADVVHLDPAHHLTRR